MYVDDILVIAHKPEDVMRILAKTFQLKDGYASPTRYLGATIKRWRLPGDEEATHWGHSAEEYIKQAIINVEMELTREGKSLQGRFSTPMSPGYRPELDYTPFLNDAAATYYMELIGILRWAVDFGCIDIMVNVSMLSSYTMNRDEVILIKSFIFSDTSSVTNNPPLFSMNNGYHGTKPISQNTIGRIFTKMSKSQYHQMHPHQGEMQYRSIVSSMLIMQGTRSHGDLKRES